jgi:hypothetical protein
MVSLPVFFFGRRSLFVIRWSLTHVVRCSLTHVVLLAHPRLFRSRVATIQGVGVFRLHMVFGFADDHVPLKMTEGTVTLGDFT